MKKKKVIRVLGIILAAILLLTGIFMILCPYILEKYRDKTIKDSIDGIEQNMNSDEGYTLVVNTDILALEAEYEYDEDALLEMQNAMDNLPQYVTLEAVGILDLPSIDIRIPVWYDATVVSLRYGGGFFTDSVLPGNGGNTTILAHHMRRADTMFHKLDQMVLGDEIIFTDTTGRVYRYEVSAIYVVSANDLLDYIMGDVNEEGTETITLVTCTYTATGKMRLVVVGELVN